MQPNKTPKYSRKVLNLMASRDQPNIVMIVLDTHRVDRLGLYGYQRHTSPNLDHFAQHATVFENAVSPAQWTIPAHAAMFTGEYPTTHQTLQANHVLDGRFDTVASILRHRGYDTIGFCNNPLVAVLSNGLKRGFRTFYNYSGAFPSVPRGTTRLPGLLDRVWTWYTQQLRKMSYPVQNAFASSDFLFQMAQKPVFVPLWTKFANFKGNTATSLRDVAQHLKEFVSRAKKPQFTFVNLMETHAPYMPPENFIHRFAPYYKDTREARDYLRRYNVETYRWLLPLDVPLSDLESQTMQDIYDTEVAYQDYLLEETLAWLNQDEVAENTLTIIVGDHGEGLGEHDFVGHSFVAYQELVHVPLIVRFPGQTEGQRISNPVSTRRLFHTMLDAAAVHDYESPHRPPSDIKPLSLNQMRQGYDHEQGQVFSEAYAPKTFLTMMEKNTPHLLERYHCRLNRRAVYQGQEKLVRIDGVRDELYDLNEDPLELEDRLAQDPEKAKRFAAKLDSFMVRALARQPDTWQANKNLDLEENETIVQQLRALGYMD